MKKYMYLFKVETVNKMIEVLIFLFCILPVILTCFYIMPAADDFANMSQMKMLVMDQQNSFFEAAAIRTNQLYWQTSGYFFAAFVNLIFSPFFRWGIIGLRIFCIGINLLLYVSLYIFVKVSLKYWLGVSKRSEIMPIYLMLLFCFTNLYLNAEASFWYCVLVAYVLMFIAILWGVLAFFKALELREKKWIVLTSVIGFLASGSSLNVTALNCFIYLLIGLYGFIVLKAKKCSVICFGSALAGAIINVLSPGNYARHDSVSSNYEIISSVYMSLKMVFMRFYEMFTNTLFPFVLLLLFVYILMFPQKGKIIKHIHPIFLGGLFAVALCVFAFPVFLGYSSDYLPDRCLFVQDAAMYLFFFAVVIYTANWLKVKYGEWRLRKENIAVLLLLTMVTFFSWHSGRSLVDTYPSLFLTKQIVNGENTKFRTYWEDVLHEIEFSEEENVVIYGKAPETSSKLISPRIGEEDWINWGVASYYDKKSVEIREEE